MKCPNCNAKIEGDDVFCGECGQNLTLPSKASPKPLSPEQKVEKIQKYLPKGIAEKILAQRDKSEESLLTGINILEEPRVNSVYSTGYLCLGEVCADTGQKDKALETLKKAEGMFK